MGHVWIAKYSRRSAIYRTTTPTPEIELRFNHLKVLTLFYYSSLDRQGFRPLSGGKAARPTRSSQPRTFTTNPTVPDKYNEMLQCGTVNDETLLKYICTDLRELDMVCDFDMVRLGGRPEVDPQLTWKHELPETKTAILKYNVFCRETRCMYESIRGNPRAGS